MGFVRNERAYSVESKELASYLAFHRIRSCRNETNCLRYNCNWNMILRQTCGQRPGMAAASKRRALAYYFSPWICKFQILQCRERRVGSRSVHDFGICEEDALRSANFWHILRPNTSKSLPTNLAAKNKTPFLELLNGSGLWSPFLWSSTDSDFPRPVRPVRSQSLAATDFIHSQAVNWVRSLWDHFWPKHQASSIKHQIRISVLNITQLTFFKIKRRKTSSYHGLALILCTFLNLGQPRSSSPGQFLGSSMANQMLLISPVNRSGPKEERKNGFCSKRTCVFNGIQFTRQFIELLLWKRNKLLVVIKTLSWRSKPAASARV